MVKLLVYIKHHLSFIWTFIEWCNSILFNLLYGRKLRKVLPGLLGEASLDTYIYKLLKKGDMQSLATFFANQPQEAYTFFNPHKLDEKSLIKKNKDKAFVMIGTYYDGQLVGYCFLRCFFNKQAFRGKIVDVQYQGRGIAKQSGDIDTWALGKPEDIIEWARRTGTMTFYDYHHADLSLYKDTEIELHYRPTLSRNLLRNARLQRWFKKEGEKHILFKEELGFSVPDYAFNIVLILNHNLWHLMYEGVGLRQILDLYFVLRSNDDSQIHNEVLKLIKHFGLLQFAEASMWIMQEVLGLEERYLLCKSDEKSGRFLLDEIMRAGNFGKFDERLSKDRYESRVGLMFAWFRHNFRLVRFYPTDVLWTPIGVLRISLWRRWRYRKDSRYQKY